MTDNKHSILNSLDKWSINRFRLSAFDSILANPMVDFRFDSKNILEVNSFTDLFLYTIINVDTKSIQKNEITPIVQYIKISNKVLRP
mmetsp:Transcript_3681/g.3174  ORF Transcript_3681/g.3174 Transcript_3681/m.3174 type:complete len:87 (-) Transcript_3681:295-555(-)